MIPKALMLINYYMSMTTKACLDQSYMKLKHLFGSVVAVAFQIAFRVKMHVNDVFLFF
jgi:hypothetical protein